MRPGRAAGWSISHWITAARTTSRSSSRASTSCCRAAVPRHDRPRHFPIGRGLFRTRDMMAAGVTMYGIKNCDTIKKARAWLDARKVAYDFHDFKTAGVEREQLEAWCGDHGWETILNRAGTTFRKLGEAQKAALSQQKAIALMLEHPSMIKRPVLQIGRRTVIGFTADRYAALFG